MWHTAVWRRCGAVLAQARDRATARQGHCHVVTPLTSQPGPVGPSSARAIGSAARCRAVHRSIMQYSAVPLPACHRPSLTPRQQPFGGGRPGARHPALWSSDSASRPVLRSRSPATRNPVIKSRSVPTVQRWQSGALAQAIATRAITTRAIASAVQCSAVQCRVACPRPRPGSRSSQGHLHQGQCSAVQRSAVQCQVASPIGGSGHLAVPTERYSGDRLSAGHPKLLSSRPCNTPCTEPSSVRVRVRVRVVPRPPFLRGSHAASGPHLGTRRRPLPRRRTSSGCGQPSPPLALQQGAS